MLKTLALKLSEGFTNQCNEYSSRRLTRDVASDLHLELSEQATFLQNLSRPGEKGLYLKAWGVSSLSTLRKPAPMFD
jgi:hypothetical protein